MQPDVSVEFAGPRPSPSRSRLKTAEWFRTRTLAVQFLTASGVLILVATLAAGHLVSEMISGNAIRTKAGATALFFQSLTEPVVQELGSSATLPPANIAKLDALLTNPSFLERFPHLEIWTPDGRVAYSRAGLLIGRTFPASPGLQQAWSGTVAADYADLSALEHTMRNFSTRYLEIYTPLHDQSSGRIIAVAEIHEDTSNLGGELIQLRLMTWALVALFFGLILLGLFGIVRRGSRTIEAQERALRQRAEEAELTSRELLELRNRARSASIELADLNEKLMRRVGADLHDGAAQYLGVAALQLEHVRDARSAEERRKPLAVLSDAIGSALAEIRVISRALMLPEIEHLGPEEIVTRAIKLHCVRTGTDVTFQPQGVSRELPPALKTCIFRFVQEGLNNAYRHAGGNGQQVRCLIDRAILEVSVRDSGPPDGFKPKDAGTGEGMGLHGLRQRVESLGGDFSVDRCPGRGTALTMTIDLDEGVLL